MEAITNLPPGKVKDKITLVSDEFVVELLEFQYGSRIRFVERISRGEAILAFRQTDEFLQDSLAYSWKQEYVELKITNEKYKLESKE